MHFDPITAAACIDRIVIAAAAGTGGLVVTANLDHVRRYRHDPRYKTIADRAEIVVADGMPVIWAARVRGTPLPERVAGSDLVWSLTQGAAQHGLSVFLLGGNPGVAEQAAADLQRHAPNLRIAGTLCPPPGFERDERQMAAIREALEASSPHLVYVALGSPKQEFLAADLAQLFPRIWWLGLGVSLSFVTGDVQRAPRWMQRLGLEWLHRVWQEPRRLARRYLVDGLPFFAGLMLRSLVARFRGTSRRTRGGRPA